jgi:hypothetical protein
LHFSDKSAGEALGWDEMPAVTPPSPDRSPGRTPWRSIAVGAAGGLALVVAVFALAAAVGSGPTTAPAPAPDLAYPPYEPEAVALDHYRERTRPGEILGAQLSTAAGIPVLPLWEGAGLHHVAGELVRGKGIAVAGVIDERTFFVGTEGHQRVLVVLRRQRGPLPRVVAGDRVGFVGRVVPNRIPTEPDREFGLTDDEDVEVVALAGHHVVVDPARLDVG